MSPREHTVQSAYFMTDLSSVMRVMTVIETAAFKMDFTFIGEAGWFNETYSNGTEQMIMWFSTCDKSMVYQ